jgi:hypothetical protein
VYHPPDFNRVFHDGEIFKYPPPYEKTLQIRLVSLGELYLPTGKIAAFDPSYSKFDAFKFAVPPGRYPVWLAIVHDVHKFENTRVASAMIKFKQQEAATWSIALLPKLGNAPSELDDFHCYGVDGGVGCFADATAASALAQTLADKNNYRSFSDNLIQNSVVPNRLCVNLLLDANTGLNVCVFESGYGDGCYSSYWGFDTHGTIVSLATAFMLGVDEENEE